MKTSLDALSVRYWLHSFDWTSPYDEKTRSTPADDATDVNSLRMEFRTSGVKACLLWSPPLSWRHGWLHISSSYELVQQKLIEHFRKSDLNQKNLIFWFFLNQDFFQPWLVVYVCVFVDGVEAAEGDSTAVYIRCAAAGQRRQLSEAVQRWQGSTSSHVRLCRNSRDNSSSCHSILVNCFFERWVVSLAKNHYTVCLHIRVPNTLMRESYAWRHRNI